MVGVFGRKSCKHAGIFDKQQIFGRSWPGWDKIFYFVGANTFSQKFRPKQRESDTTEGVQNTGNLGIKYGI